MTAYQLPMPFYDDRTPFDRALYEAIRDYADSQTGVVVSLFDLTERKTGLCYRHAVPRLRVLEMLGWVKVEQRRPGYPLVMRPLV